MDNTWSIQLLNADGSLNGGPVTIAALGIESATYDLNNLAADVLTLTVGGRAIDAAQLWPFGQLVALLNPAGVRVFFGRVEPWSREGSPDTQNHLGRLVNPWWYLTQKIYEQVFRIPTAFDLSGNPITYTTFTTPRCVLNVLYDAVNGFRAATTGEQIADVLAWAISKGAPIKVGTLDPATKPFSDFQKGIFCSDAIKLMFRKEPDFVIDWDYSTVPFPTIHFRKAVSLVPLLIDLTAATIREQVRIKERPDWQRSYVRIIYDQTNSQNGGQFLNVYEDWYSALGQGNTANGARTGVALPADTESLFRGVDLFCDLTGSASTTTSQTASFASVPFDINDIATWRKWKPSLESGTVESVVINPPPSGTTGWPAAIIAPQDELDDNGNPVAYNPACVNEMVDGQWATWIPGVASQRVRVLAWAKIKHKTGGVRYEHLSHDITAVSANTGGVSKDYVRVNPNISSYAEPVPVGLAKAMWTSWQNLAIEGGFTNVEAVCGTTAITRSHCLNFKTAAPGVNGAPDWRNVNALVQRISGDIGRGITRVEFGAPLHITGHDLVDAVRATRFRVTTIDLGYLFGGSLGGGGGSVRMARKTHARHSQHGGTHHEKLVVSVDPSVAPVDTQGTIDPAGGQMTFS